MDAEQDAARGRLRLAGFDEDAIAKVLRAAKRNRFNLLAFAERAIRLRRHVQSGCRL